MLRTFFSGMHDVALIETGVIRCYFNNNFYSIILILMNEVVRHICCCCFVVIHQLAIYRYKCTDLFVYMLLQE